MDGKHIVNGKVVAQTYGRRTNFVATTKSNHPIQASVLHRRMGKSRGVRVATNIPRSMGNSWVYVTNSIDIDRLHHWVAPSMINSVNAASVARAKYAWDDFLSSVYVMTWKQRTTDWFLGHLFQFSSTSFHVLKNVVTAVYIDEQHMKECHQICKDIVQLDRRNSITIKYALSLEIGG